MARVVVDTSFGRVALTFESDRLISVEQTNDPVGGDLPETLSAPVLACLNGETDGREIAVSLSGSPFQQRVWTEMRKIPIGEVRTYSELAKACGNARATRAVANACGANPCIVVVPCHRVVRRDGGLGGFAWGTALKRALLEREGVRLSSDDTVLQTTAPHP
jgi:O-6-methylguanine DNA methyltransferase